MIGLAGPTNSRSAELIGLTYRQHLSNNKNHILLPRSIDTHNKERNTNQIISASLTQVADTGSESLKEDR